MDCWKRAWRGGRADLRLHLLSILSLTVVFLCLGTSLLLLVNAQTARKHWSSSSRVSVFLRPQAPPERVAELERALRQTPGVREVRHVSSDEARRELLSQRADEVLEALPADAFPASLEVELVPDLGSERLQELSGKLAPLPIVESVETYGPWSARLSRLLEGGATACSLLMLLVLGAAASVVSATVRLMLERRRIEVEILRLVGATDAYLHRPFLIEGAAQGAVGATCAVILLGVLYAIVRARLDGQLAALFGVGPTFLPWSISVALMALGALLGAVAARLSLSRFY